ncbi:MAG TPA: carboxypeptidase regulatory-like domain-containing protein [Candidatus Acidoferrales bacterium]|nr:carboxypeptidase regulatory-like domain-containing protein [Candidatus Acidoferrales bacterium]
MKGLLRICRASVCLALLVATTFLTSGPAFTQSTVSLRGNVTDPSGAAIPIATVHLVDSASNSELTATTDPHGSYAFSAIAPGIYSVVVEAQGFEKFEQGGVHIAANATAPVTLNAQLQIAQVQQSVTVRPENGETCLTAFTRFLPDVGPGLRAIRRAPSGNYYVLIAPRAAVAVYSPDGKRIGQVPAAPSPTSSLVYGSDLQVDSAGRIYVADRGANAIRTYSPAGAPIAKVHVLAPISVEPLSGGEIAVASLSSQHLVDVYDPAHGDVDHSFGDVGDPEIQNCNDQTFDCTTRPDPRDLKDPDVTENGMPSINRSWFYGDLVGDIFVDLAFRAAPTIRAYDGYGSRSFETAFTSNASSQSGPWSVNPGVRVAGGLIATTNGAAKSSSSDSSSDNTSSADTTSPNAPTTQGGGRKGRGEGGMGGGPMALGLQLSRHAGPTEERMMVDAMTVDSASGEVWAMIGGNLVHLDKQGNLLGQYCLPTIDNMPLKPVTMLIEPNRILIGTDPFGIFAYPRPDKPLPASSPAR